MELLQLQYFEKTATMQSISKAAAALHITQPALSNAISRLEKELGTTFFDREGRGIKLNNQGIYLLAQVRKILGTIDSIKAEHYSSISGGLVSIAVDTHCEILLDCIREFRKINPQIAFRIYAEIRVWDSVAPSEYDLLIHSTSLRLPYATHRMKLGTQNYYAVLPVGHPLANKPIHITDLQEEYFCFVQVEPLRMEAAYGLCIESGFSPKIAATSTNMYEKISLIHKNIGIGIVASGNLDLIVDFPNLAVSPIYEGTNTSDICLSWKAQPDLSPAAMLFIKFAKDFFKNSVQNTV